MSAGDVARAVYLSKPVRTFAQTLLGFVSVAVIAGRGFDAIAWTTVLSSAGLAALYSLMQAVADGVPITTRAPAPAAREDSTCPIAPPTLPEGDDDA